MKSKVIYIPQSLNQSASVEVEKVIDEQLVDVPATGKVESIVPVGEDKVIVFYTPAVTGGGSDPENTPEPGPEIPNP